jgi:hypothetical protein
VSNASLEVQERWTATKKNPEQSILGAYSSLCLRLFCPGNLGASGDGGKSPDGPACTGTLPDPARAICDSHHDLGPCAEGRLRSRSASSAISSIARQSRSSSSIHFSSGIGSGWGVRTGTSRGAIDGELARVHRAILLKRDGWRPSASALRLRLRRFGIPHFPFPEEPSSLFILGYTYGRD